MKVRIVKHVPGLVNFRPLSAGIEYELESPVAVSLMEDGYAEMVGLSAAGRATPDSRRETATAVPGNPGRRAPGRPRKEG